jgi:hypothetical protein
VDSLVVFDQVGYETGTCAELVSEGSEANLNPTTPWYLQVVSTSCWRAEVALVDESGDTLKTWNTAFGIYDRKEGEKERGRQGWIVWNGKDAEGVNAPKGRYAMHVQFDFGRSRTLQVDSDVFKDVIE